MVEAERNLTVELTQACLDASGSWSRVDVSRATIYNYVPSGWNGLLARGGERPST